MSKEKYTNNFDSYDEYDESGQSNDKRKKILFIVGGLVVLALIVAGGIFAKGKMEISSLNKKAENFIDIKDYQEAAKIYSDLYSKTGDIEYKSKKNQMDIMAETKSSMEEAKNLEQQGEYVKAIAIYKQIPAEDKDNYKKASDKISSLKSDVVKKASSMIDSGNTTSASSLLSEYLGLIPDDKTASDLYKKVAGKTETEVKQVVVKESSSQSSSSSNLSAAHRTANSINGSYQYVTAKEANIRSGPSKSSPSVNTVYKGDEIYIFDTYVESANRIWCKTYGGWISYNTLNGNIR